MSERFFDHALAEPLLQMRTIPQYNERFQGCPKGPPGKPYYPAMAASLDRATFEPAFSWDRAFLPPRSLLAFQARGEASLEDHLKQLVRLGLRPVAFWEAVYFDQVVERDALPDEPLYAFGEVVCVDTEQGRLFDRIPFFLRRTAELGLITFDAYQVCVPSGSLYLAAEEFSG